MSSLQKGLVAGVAIGFLLKTLLTSCSSGSADSSEEVYDLIVKLKLKRAQDVALVMEKFEPLRHYCNTVEKPTTVTYEAFVDENADDTIIIVERYTTKEALTGIHHKSEEFLTFAKWLGGSDLVEAKEKMSGHVRLTNRK